MNKLPRDFDSRRQIQGQLAKVPELSITRQDGVQGDSVTYKLALGLTLLVTAKGVSFAGNSPTFGRLQIFQYIKILRWCERISRNLAQGRGIVPQLEVQGDLRLKYRAVDEGGFESWYEGRYAQRALGSTVEASIANTRSLFRKMSSA